MGMERLDRQLPHLERGHHLALFFAVYQAVLVLHRNEGRKAIVDRVICWGAKKGKDFESISQGRVAGYDDTYSASDGLVVHKGGLIRGPGDERLMKYVRAHIDMPSKNSCQCSGPNPFGRRHEALASADTRVYDEQSRKYHIL